MSKLIFLDSNVFLHYQDFDQINWLEIAQADDITIVIPPVSIRELNKVKETHPRARLRKRAGNILKKLSGLFASGPQSQLRDGVIVQFEDCDPLVDFASYNLNREVQDDHLIASIIMYRDERPSSEIALFTSDVGLTMMAKARRHRITAISLPDNLKLAEELDLEQERIKELEREIQQLKLKTPQVSLAFEDSGQHATFVLPQPIELSNEEAENRLNEVKSRYPKRGQASNPSYKLPEAYTSLAETLANLSKSSLFTATPEDIDNYNSELDEFYLKHATHLQNEVRFENLKRRTIKLDIWLANDGTAPAEDIDIFLHFPDGISVVNEDDFPEPPDTPEPPSRPESAMYRLLDLNRSISLPYLGHIAPTPVRPPPNVSSPRIRRTNSYYVEIHVQRIKHKLREPFDALYVIFESYETAASFHIDYEILAANLPQESSGRLHIIIQK
jgi:predicted nucleic acid-binding protein